MAPQLNIAEWASRQMAVHDIEAREATGGGKLPEKVIARSTVLEEKPPWPTDGAKLYPQWPTDGAKLISVDRLRDLIQETTNMGVTMQELNEANEILCDINLTKVVNRSRMIKKSKLRSEEEGDDRVIVAELREAIQDATDRGQTHMQSFDNAKLELERWCDEWIPAALKALVKHSSGNPVRAERSQ
jgi:hypothetical protein